MKRGRLLVCYLLRLRPQEDEHRVDDSQRLHSIIGVILCLPGVDNLAQTLSKDCLVDVDLVCHLAATMDEG